MAQIPVLPIATAPSSSHRPRDAPWQARARVAQRRPRNTPRHEAT